MPLWGQHRNGLQTLKKLVHLTTIMSPTQDGRHKLPVVTTDDADTAAEKFPHTRFVALGEATQEHLRGLFKELSGRSSSISRDKFASFLLSRRERPSCRWRRTSTSSRSFLRSGPSSTNGTL